MKVRKTLCSKRDSVLAHQSQFPSYNSTTAKTISIRLGNTETETSEDVFFNFDLLIRISPHELFFLTRSSTLSHRPHNSQPTSREHANNPTDVDPVPPAFLLENIAAPQYSHNSNTLRFHSIGEECTDTALCLIGTPWSQQYRAVSPRLDAIRCVCVCVLCVPVEKAR